MMAADDITTSRRAAFRPRIAPVGSIDEKIATAFVDRAMSVIDEAIENDLVFIKALKENGIGSFGNVKGQQRFSRRMQAATAKSPTSLMFASFPDKKKFLFDWDRLIVEDDKICVARLFVEHRKNRSPETATAVALEVTRHGMIRIVERAEVRSVEEVLRFWKEVWQWLWKPLGAMEQFEMVTPARTSWMLPARYEGKVIGVLISRPIFPQPPALVTVYREDWIPTHIYEAMTDLANEAVNPVQDEWNAAAQSIFPKLLV